MGFTFLTPLYLIGLLSAAIPLIIHLSRSRRTKKMRFSTTRFFTEQFLRSYRMSRLKELLLLACRMALFAILAMALARPLFLPKGTAGAVAGGGPRSAIIVLDDSASMGYAEDGVTLFRRAQEAAGTILGSLSSGDRAAVVLAGRREAGPDVLFEEPTDDLEELRRMIDRATVRSLGTDLSGAIARAELMASAARASGRSAQIYVLSDLQESARELPAEEISSEKAEISYVFVGIRPRKETANRAVTAVRYAATRPRVGVPFLGRE